MGPTNKEMQLCKNCQLYAYVLSSQGKEVPEIIEDCIESFDYVVNCVAELSAELESLDSETFERVVNNKELLESRELAYWWEMQQEANRLHDSLGSTCI